MDRHWKVFLLCSVLCLVLVPRIGTSQEAPRQEHKVFIEVCVAEVSLEKLKSFGIDWAVLVKQIAPSDADAHHAADGPVDAINFVRALGELNLVDIVAQPRLATMSNRSASLAVGDRQAGDAIELNVTPEVTEQKKIRLKYDMRVSRLLPIDQKITADPPLAIPRGRRVVAHSATIELTPGHTVCVNDLARRQTDEKGIEQEVTSVVFVRADFQPPADIRTAQSSSAPQTAPEKRYRDVETPRKR